MQQVSGHHGIGRGYHAAAFTCWFALSYRFKNLYNYLSESKSMHHNEELYFDSGAAFKTRPRRIPAPGNLVTCIVVRMLFNELIIKVKPHCTVEF